MRTFEFHSYPCDEDGNVPSMPVVTAQAFEEKASAVAFAGRLAKRNKGPVDVALVDHRPWEERYVTTASPCSYNRSGYRTERIL